MLRRHASLLVAISLIMLVVSACIVRTNRPRRGGPVYRPAPGEHRKDHRKNMRKHRKDRRKARRGSFEHAPREAPPERAAFVTP